MTQPTGKAPELDLELDSEIADGIYSNLAIISHSTSEFIVDFATILPGLLKPTAAEENAMPMGFCNKGEA